MEHFFTALILGNLTEFACLQKRIQGKSKDVGIWPKKWIPLYRSAKKCGSATLSERLPQHPSKNEIFNKTKNKLKE